MQNILSKYSSLYLTNQTNRSAHKDYFSNPKGVTWEAVLNVQDWSTVGGAGGRAASSPAGIPHICRGHHGRCPCK